jgi:hypothetical protein
VTASIVVRTSRPIEALDITDAVLDREPPHEFSFLGSRSIGLSFCAERLQCGQ